MAGTSSPPPSEVDLEQAGNSPRNEADTADGQSRIYIPNRMNGSSQTMFGSRGNPEGWERGSTDSCRHNCFVDHCGRSRSLAFNYRGSLDGRYLKQKRKVHSTLGQYCKRIILFIIFLVPVAALGFGVYCFMATSDRLAALELEMEESRDVLRHCLPCRLLSGEVGLTWKQATGSQGQTLCCVRDSEQLADILEKAFATSLQKDPTAPSDEDSLPSNLCAAHVYYEEGHRGTTSYPGLAVITDWKAGGNHAMIRSGIAFSPATGSFTVNQDGLYTIYSHLTYMAPVQLRHRGGEPGTAAVDKTFTQRIQIAMEMEHGRYISVDFLEDTQTATCQSHGGSRHVSGSCHVSSIISTLYLRRHDRVTVVTSDLDLVLGNTKSTFFGIHRLGA